MAHDGQLGRALGGPGPAAADRPADEAYIVQVATTRPKRVGRPFTHWSVRKLAAYLADNSPTTRWPWSGSAGNSCGSCCTPTGSRFQRTRTWKTSTDPEYDAKLDRIEEVLSKWLDRCFAFDQFGPLSIRPCHGTCWAVHKHPDRLPAAYHRTHGIRYFHGCYDLAQDRLWGITRLHKGGKYTSPRSRASGWPTDDKPIYVILDNLSANKTPRSRPGPFGITSSCASPRPTPPGPTRSNHSSGPLRCFVIGNSDHPNHVVLARAIQAFLRWRNTHNRDPEVIAAQRRERTRARSERHQRWGRPRPPPGPRPDTAYSPASALVEDDAGLRLSCGSPRPTKKPRDPSEASRPAATRQPAQCGRGGGGLKCPASTLQTASARCWPGRHVRRPLTPGWLRHRGLRPQCASNAVNPLALNAWITYRTWSASASSTLAINGATRHR